MASAARGTALLLLMASVALIVAATTMPWSMYYVGHSHWARVEWLPFSRRVRPVDFLLNILLFAPFGFSAYACRVAGGHAPLSPDATNNAANGFTVRRQLLGVVIVSILLSTAVELFQVYSHGRLPTTTDVMSNALGAFLGARWAAARAGR